MKKRLSPIILLILLAACSPKTMFEDFANDSIEAIAMNYMNQIMKGEYDEIKDALEPDLRPILNDEMLGKMTELLGTEELHETNLIGYQVRKSNTAPTGYNLSYQFGYTNKWIVANVAFRTLENGKNEIFGLNVYNPMEKSLQETHRFTLKGKSPIHFVFLFFCICVPIFIIVSLITLIRTKLEKRKWLWIIFVLIGFAQFSINWTTGQFGVRPISVQLFGSSAFAASLYSAWVLSFSLPIGAIIFWIKRHELKRAAIRTERDAANGVRQTVD